MKTVLALAVALAVPGTALAAPELTVPSTVRAEATSPAGAEVQFTASAYTVTGTGVRRATVFSCAWGETEVSGRGEASFSALFPLGTTTVTCTKSDDLEPLVKSFPVTVRDTTPPVLRGVPAARKVEATSLDGATETYATPTASDVVDGVVPVACTPRSGSVFPIGATTVVCTAVDDHGNRASDGFRVTVADTKPPTLVVPDALKIAATRADGTPATDPRLREFLAGAWAVDSVDPAPVVRSRHPSVFPVGTTGVRFTAADRFGNVTSKSVAVTVSPLPGVLLSPASGARLSSPPVLRWTRATGATYYNVQLWRNGRKILSAWPTATRYALRTAWTFAGRRYRLSPGTYRWYVWPGLGARAAARYGRLLGTRTFVMRG